MKDCGLEAFDMNNEESQGEAQSDCDLTLKPKGQGRKVGGYMSMAVGVAAATLTSERLHPFPYDRCGRSMMICLVVARCFVCPIRRSSSWTSRLC